MNKMKEKNNYAYIDGANLHKGVGSLGWNLDYRRFRVWLSEKYGVRTAYLFIGLIPKYKELYNHLQRSGFILVFKEVVYDGDGKPKGNCDADLVQQVICDTYEDKCDKIVIVASDGDYAGLVKFLLEREKLLSVISPSNEKKCSILIKRTSARIAYINDQRSILRLSQNKKALSRDELCKGLFRGE